MQIERLRISQIRYNPEAAGFEALVTIRDRAVTFRYPAFLPAPLNAGYAHVARALSQRAMAAHRNSRTGMRARLLPPATAGGQGHSLPLAA